MAKLKYKDKDGFWQELPVGTNVVANPTLTGTEQELTSLQVGNTKYKSGGGKVYMHRVYLYDTSRTKEYNLIFYSSFLTKVNSVELIMQYEKYMTGLALDIPNSRPAYYSANNGAMRIVVTTNGNAVDLYYDEITSITDTVTEL